MAFVLDTEAEEEGNVVQLTERYCVVLQTIGQGPRISDRAKRKGGGGE